MRVAISSAFLMALAVPVAACTVLNSYQPVPDGTGGGGVGGTADGGSGGSSTGVGGSGGGIPQCNEAACEAASGDCVTCTCLQGLVCDCDPVVMGTACSLGVCDATGSCVECLDEECSGGLICTQNQCVEGSCTDGLKSQLETDVDCGGPECPPCANGDECLVPEDCTSIHCGGGVCVPCSLQPHCGPFLYCDVDEGTCLPEKANFQACAEDYECQSGACVQYGNFMICANP